jgi:hypothetical protein
MEVTEGVFSTPAKRRKVEHQLEQVDTIITKKLKLVYAIIKLLFHFSFNI